jgi:hypothetical protein
VKLHYCGQLIKTVLSRGAFCLAQNKSKVKVHYWKSKFIVSVLY